MTKYVFIAGGVCSSLGKGIIASSLLYIFKQSGLRVGIKKIDPYLNLCAGNMDPYQHGEVFVTDDGYEADLDMGHYERISGVTCSHSSNITAGLIYNKIINNEQSGAYLGQTVQVIPHLTNGIIEQIMSESEEYDILLCELGGTIGDIEILPFLESVRQIKFREKSECVFIMASLVPYMKAAKEFKTKPTQHSCRTLLSCGIQPDIIITRSETRLSDKEVDKIKMLCNIESVYQSVDVGCIYSVVIDMIDQGIYYDIAKRLDIHQTIPNISKRLMYIDRLVSMSARPKLRLGLIAKYSEVGDAYKSLCEAVDHAATSVGCTVEIVKIDARNLETCELEAVDCIIIPGGFGLDGFAGKVNAAMYAMKRDIPILGICYGMQAMVIAALKLVKGIAAVSREHSSLADAMVAIVEKSPTLLCGGMNVNLTANSAIAKIYHNQTHVRERFRNRFYTHEDVKKILNDTEVQFTAVDTQGMLVGMETRGKKFEVGVQYHPEFISTPEACHPLLFELIHTTYYTKNPQASQFEKTKEQIRVSDFKICIISGKPSCTELSYKSLIEAVDSCGFKVNVLPVVDIIHDFDKHDFDKHDFDKHDFDKDNLGGNLDDRLDDLLGDYNGIILYGSYEFDFDTMVKVASYGIENDIPTFGICYAMDAIIAAATQSTHNAPAHSAPDIMAVNAAISACSFTIDTDQRISKIYGANAITEYSKHTSQHDTEHSTQHDTEHSTNQDNKLRFSGYHKQSPNIVNMCNKKWIIGVKFNPEFNPEFNTHHGQPHPLFSNFTKFAYENYKNQTNRGN